MKSKICYRTLILVLFFVIIIDKVLFSKEVCMTRADGARITCPDEFHCEKKGDSFDCVKKKPGNKSVKDKVKDKNKKKTKAEKEKEKAAYRAVVAEKAADKAQLSVAVYNNTGAPLGWKRGTPYDKPSGLYAAVFTKDGQTVLAFRGTEGIKNVKDVRADAAQATGAQFRITGGAVANPNTELGLNIPTAQYADAVKIAEEVRKSCNCELVLTGHSLGGGLASYAAGKLDLEAYTFNAAALSPAYYAEANNHAERIKNLRVQKDPFSAGFHVGETITYPHKKNPHDIENFAQYLSDLAEIK